MGILLSWLILAAAVWIAAAVLPGMRLKGVGNTLIVAALFGILNFFLGWLLFTVIGLGTLGLGFLLAFITRWIVDALILKLTDAFTDRLTVNGFGTAMLAALIIAGVGTLGQYLVGLAF